MAIMDPNNGAWWDWGAGPVWMSQEDADTFYGTYGVEVTKTGTDYNNKPAAIQTNGGYVWNGIMEGWVLATSITDLVEMDMPPDPASIKTAEAESEPFSFALDPNSMDALSNPVTTVASADPASIAPPVTETGMPAAVFDPITGLDVPPDPASIKTEDPFVAPDELGDQQMMLPWATQFAAALQKQFGSGAANPFKYYLEGQYADLLNLFNLDYASGAPGAGADVSFADWLGSKPGGISKVDPNAFAAYTTKGTNVLNAGTYEGMPVGDKGLLEFLTQGTAENPNLGQENQFNLALAGAYPGMSQYAMPYLNKAAQNAFAQFQFNQPKAQFLPWFVGKGNSFF